MTRGVRTFAVGGLLLVSARLLRIAFFRGFILAFPAILAFIGSLAFIAFIAFLAFLAFFAFRGGGTAAYLNARCVFGPRQSRRRLYLLYFRYGSCFGGRVGRVGVVACGGMVWSVYGMGSVE